MAVVHQLTQPEQKAKKKSVKEVPVTSLHVSFTRFCENVNPLKSLSSYKNDKMSKAHPPELKK